MIAMKQAVDTGKEPIEPDKSKPEAFALSVQDLVDNDLQPDGISLIEHPALLLTLQPLQALASVVWDNGMLCMAISASIQSLSALLVKLTDGRVPIFEIVVVRSMICMGATYVLICMRGLPHILGGMQYLFAKFMRGFAGAVSMSFYYYAVFHLSLSDTVTIFFSHPAMVVLLAWFVRGETVGWPALLGIALSMMGVVLVSKPPFLFAGAHWTDDHVSGVIACLFAAFTAAIAFVSVRFIPKTEPSICVAAWFHFMGLLTAGIPLMFGIPDWPVLPSVQDSFCVLGVGICSFLSHVLIARSLQLESAAKAASAGFLQVVFAYTYGLAFLGEYLQLLSVAGSLVICMGVIATSWPSKEILPAASSNEDDELLPLTSVVAGAVAMVEEDTSEPYMEHSGNNVNAVITA